LGIGGDDVTQCLLAVLLRNKFPYSDMNLANTYEWHMLEELKCKHCSLADVRSISKIRVSFQLTSLQNAVAITTYEFTSRRPEEKTRKIVFQAYDEMVLAPMVSSTLHAARISSAHHFDSVPLRHSPN
jgi:actin-related protein 8